MGPGSVLLRRIGVWSVLMGIFAGTFFLQLDRQTRLTPQLGPMVPDAFASQALSTIVDAALVQEREDAYSMATNLLARRPIPAESLAAFSLAAAAEDDLERANSAMSLAAGRSWRVALVNGLALQGAYAAQDYLSATLRLAALSQTEVSDDAIATGLALLSQDEDGRKAIIDYASENPKFAANIIRVLPSAVNSADSASIVSRFREAAIDVPCDDLARITRAMLREGDAGAAVTAWRGACRRVDRDDMEFAQDKLVGMAVDPFAWTLRPQPGISVSPNDRGVVFRNRDHIARVVAERTLVLEPGSYDFSVTLAPKNSVATMPAAKVSIETACYPRSARIRHSWQTGLYRIEVGNDCLVQQLRLVVARGSAEITSLQLRRESP